MPIKNIVGEKFGKLTVIARDEQTQIDKGSRKVHWLCQCECGNTRVLPKDTLKRMGDKISCVECRKANELAGTAEYHAWENAKQRCFNPNHPSYKNYGKRGITMCDEFANSFKAFYDEVGPRPTIGKWCIDRIDEDGNYEPGNLRWVSESHSNSNKRSRSSCGEKNIRVDNRYEKVRYRVEMTVEGKRYRFGSFDTIEEAVKARDAKFKELGW